MTHEYNDVTFVPEVNRPSLGVVCLLGVCTDTVEKFEQIVTFYLMSIKCKHSSAGLCSDKAVLAYMAKSPGMALYKNHIIIKGETLDCGQNVCMGY